MLACVSVTRVQDATRRRLLTSAIGGITLGVAGCADQATELAGGGSEDERTEPETEGPTSETEGSTDYTAWLLAPAAYDTDHYVVDVRRPSEILTHQEAFDEDATILREVRGAGDLFANSETEMLLNAGTLSSLEFTVVVGGYEVDEVEAAITSDSDFDLEEAGSLHGFTLYQADEGNDPVAVSEDAVVISEHRTMMDPAIEAWAGERERYADVSDPFGTVVDALGDGTSIKAQTYDPDDHQLEEYVPGAIASGSRLRVDGDTTEYSGALVFEDSPSVETVRNRLGETEYFASVRDVDVRTEGRTAVVSGTMDTDSLGRTYPYLGGILVESRSR